MAELKQAYEPRDHPDNPAVSAVSHFNDPVWHMDGWRPGSAGRTHYLWRWDFEMSDGSLFSDQQWQALRVVSKRYLLSMRDDPPEGRTPCSMPTIASRYRLLRVLIDWTHRQGYRQFSDLDRDDIERFIQHVASRKGHSGEPLKRSTLRHYVVMLRSLYLQAPKIDGGLTVDPMAGAVDKEIFVRGRSARSMGGNKPYTPDEIAVPLIAGAVRLIGRPADDIIALRDRAQSIYTEGLAAGLDRTKAGRLARADTAGFRFSKINGEDTPWRPPHDGSTKTVRQLTDRLVDACLIVILYLVGMRISEVLALDGDCLVKGPETIGREPVYYIEGRIFKTSRTEEGKPHLWVAPAPVVRAIKVMRKLTAPYREISGEPNLFQSMLSTGLIGPSARVSRPIATMWNNRMSNLFAPFIDLPDYEGRPWHITSHQGRHTFARFVGKRDRTGLHALQKHYGHVTRVMTDSGYVGTDFELGDLVDRATLNETHSALERLMTATRLAGPAGRRISERSVFRGRTVDKDVSAFVGWVLEDTDMRLGVCDWGYCVYRQESSACQGNEKAPNEALRTESVCASCSNFALTDEHAPYWRNRRDRNQKLLENPSLDHLSRDLALKRIDECETLLAELESSDA